MYNAHCDPTSSPELDPRLAVSRWVVTLIEPLLRVRVRVEFDETLQQALVTNPQFVLRWFAGTITMVAQSLPAEDPWRNLAVTYLDNGGHKHLYPNGHDLPLDQTGARTVGRVFGSHRDHTDLLQPIFTDWKADPGLAPVSEDLTSASSAIIGVAGHGDWEQTLDLLNRIRADHQARGVNVAELFFALADALRFVLHRRRSYVGAEDDYPQLVFHTWITFAWDYADGVTPRLDLAPRDGAIADGDEPVDLHAARQTGASSGLGVAAARAIAEAGAHLVLAARRTDLLDALAIELSDKGAEVRVVACDVTVIDDCETVARQAVEQFGRIDVLVNNAGVGQAGSALREDPHIFRRTIDVNLNGAYWMSRACAPHMRPGSSIVNIASVLGQVASLMPQAGYVASKAGLLGLTRDLAQQWTGRRGIRVNALCPGYFASEITAGEGAELLEEMVREHSLVQRFAHLQEIVSPLLFLAGPGSSYMTGTFLVVDGGMSATV